MTNEFPKMLYKPGSELQVDFKGVDTLTVADAEAEKAARADGWGELADAQAPKAKGAK